MFSWYFWYKNLNCSEERVVLGLLALVFSDSKEFVVTLLESVILSDKLSLTILNGQVFVSSFFA